MKELTDDNVLNIYRFGSFVYGTNDVDSDQDYILVVKDYYESDSIDKHIYTVEQFQNLLNNCDIQMLECYSIQPHPFANKDTGGTSYLGDNVLKHNQHFNFKLNLHKLRESISTIASNSFVKGKKKLIVTGDYDLRAGLKSIFHSLRILEYGIQVAQHGKIINFQSRNYILDDLKKLSESYQRLELWEKINEKYKPFLNQQSSIFKALAPKDLEQTNKKIVIRDILKKYDIENNELLDELLNRL